MCVLSRYVMIVPTTVGHRPRAQNHCSVPTYSACAAIAARRTDEYAPASSGVTENAQEPSVAAGASRQSSASRLRAGGSSMTVRWRGSGAKSRSSRVTAATPLGPQADQYWDSTMACGWRRRACLSAQAYQVAQLPERMTDGTHPVLISGTSSQW